MPDPIPKTESKRSQVAEALTVGATLGLLVPALVPFVISFHPEVFLDVDPRVVEHWMPARALGPTGMSWVQVWAVFAAGLALGVALWRGAAISWIGVGLAAVGIGFCLWHMAGPMQDRLRGGAWLAAVCLGLAGMHLGQFAVARRWAVAVFVAMLGPLFFDALHYVLIEHPAVVQNFVDRQQEIFAANGWKPGSVNAMKYEQRLRASDVSGAFGLSNVLGSLNVALTMLAASVCLGLIRSRTGRARWWALVPAGLGLLGVVSTWLTNSRGALLTLPAGLVLIGLCWWIGRVIAGPLRGPGNAALHGPGPSSAPPNPPSATEPRSKCKWIIPAAAFAMIGLVIAAVLVRGMIGANDDVTIALSVLFRFHYWQGAWNMLWADWPGEPGAWLKWAVGVGPSAFDALYPHFKNPISPEDVLTTHNVWIDYIAMLGLGGWALSALLVFWLWRAGVSAGAGQLEADGLTSAATHRGLEHDTDTAPDASSSVFRRYPQLVIAGLFGAVIFGLQYPMILPELTLSSALVWLLSVAGFVATLTTLMVLQRPNANGGSEASPVTAPEGTEPRRSLDAWTRIGLFAAAACLLIHSQIAMAFFHLSATMPAWLLVGLAAAGRPKGCHSREGGHPGEAVNAEGHRTGPRQRGDGPNALAPFSKASWMKWLPAASALGLGVAMIFSDALPVTQEQQLVERAARALSLGRPRLALGQLQQAARFIGVDDQPLGLRIRLSLSQASYLHRQGRPNAASQRLESTLATIRWARQRGMGGGAAARYTARLRTMQARLFDDAQARDQAVQATLAALDYSPFDPQAHVRAADRMRQLDRPEQAAALYRQALKNSQRYFLDPLAQLSEKDRERAEEFLNPTRGD